MMLKSFAYFATVAVLLLHLMVPYSVNAANIPGTTIPNTVTRLMVTNPTNGWVAMAVTAGVNACTSGTPFGTGGIEVIDNTGTVQTGTQLAMSNPNIVGYALPPTMASPYEIINNFQTGGVSSNCLEGINVSFTPICTNGIPPLPLTSCPDVVALTANHCPTTTFPNGITIFEPTLNLPAGNEALDISAVNGANSVMQVTITAPSTNALLWNYDFPTQSIAAGQSVSSENSWVLVNSNPKPNQFYNGLQYDGCDDNCSKNGPIYGVPPKSGTDRPWVQPFGCTLCNEFPDDSNTTQPCGQATIGQFCAADNGFTAGNSGCSANRSPQTMNPQTQQFGGTVLLTYVSQTVPPASCPGSTPPPPPPPTPTPSNPNHHNKALPPGCVLPAKPTAKQLREYYEMKDALLRDFIEHGINHKNGKGMPNGCDGRMMTP